MSRSDSQSVISIKLPNAVIRWLLLISTALLAIFGSWVVVRWYFGSVLAEYAPPAEEGGLEMTRLAARWAPDDPYTHWRLGALEEENFSAENLANAVREYELAVTLSPNDFRYWLELGRGLEAAGDTNGAEKALQRAVEVAPSYSNPQWYFGNVLLRQGKLNEAFEHLRVAAANDESMRPQVFSLAWQAFDKNPDTIVRSVCPTSLEQMQFTDYLVSIDAFDDAMRIWESIGPADRRARHELAEKLQQALIEKKQLRKALEVMRDIATSPATAPTAEHFWNGDFERDALSPPAKPFGWIIESHAQAQIGIDEIGHSGHRSLRMIFKAPDKLDAIKVSQIIVVEPATSYRFECYARTENLNSAATPAITIFDGADNTLLASSQPLPVGTNGWQRIIFDFKTKANGDSISLSFSRGACGGGQQLCPIFGTIWYDDFSIQRINASSLSGREPAKAER